jgi:transcriptional regulator GlxA family with amidase domain
MRRNAAEALRIAYLLKLHDEGQLPFATLIRNEPHGDGVVRACQEWLRARFKENDAITKVIARAGIPERTLKRRFKTATGSTLIEHLQNLRVEHEKRFLEESNIPIDEISAEAGYEDASFFRRLFRRSTGLSRAQYRRVFQSLGSPSLTVTAPP